MIVASPTPNLPAVSHPRSRSRSPYTKLPPWQHDSSSRRSPTLTTPSASPRPQPTRSQTNPHFRHTPSPHSRLSPHSNHSPIQQAQLQRPHRSESTPISVPQRPELYHPDPTDNEAWPIDFKAHPSIEYPGYRRSELDTYTHGRWEREEALRNTTAFDIPNVSIYSI